MATSFRSSKDIIKESESLFSRLDGNYWAHIDGRNPTESLFEHSRLVADYLGQIIDAHGLESVINNIINRLCNSVKFQSPEKAGDFIKEFFINSIFLHDLGKVNPNFQVRLKNFAFKDERLGIKHFHAFPGAYIFCVIYFQRIFDDTSLMNEDQNLLAFMTFCLSNPIIKHHSSFLDSYDRFNEKDILLECQRFLKLYQISASENLCIDIFLFADEIKERFKENANEYSFLCLYALIKLSYSLLTASDFYATNEFMGDIKISEFGLIKDELRKKIKEKFWSTKSYNVDLLKNFDSYASTTFNDLHAISSKNLNILRQKITGEVISTLRENVDNRWYYIEAPTGAGKTNLSLACISELLEVDRTLNKVFYVFPFTTLITQTIQGIKETIELTNNDIIPLHSKTGLHQKSENSEKDANYGHERTLYLDHLFVNYPFVITSHVKFFEIVKGHDKETNYLFHRLSNSIVVIDEIQSYNPKHWDKIIYFIENYADMLNMRFIIMSATLPKIDKLSRTAKGKFTSLIQNKDDYFHNSNFIKRVEFDFSLIEDLKSLKKNKDNYFEKLAIIIRDEAEKYAFLNNNRVRVLVEFITKNSASQFINYIIKSELFDDYKIYIISGDILEPRRKEIIQKLKIEEDPKVILISTQVVEAGVDIDMDLGFKNRAILDSDEQMAGRINRNASKKNCKVFLFELDNIKTIYGLDERYKQQQSNEYFERNWKNILTEKKFHELYQKVFEERLRQDWTDKGRFTSYIENFQRLDFRSIQNEFTLIEDNQTVTVFIPKNIDIPDDFEEITLLQEFSVLDEDGKISGEKVFSLYIKILTRDSNIFNKRIDLKKIAGLISMFTINLYPKALQELGNCFDQEKEKYGFKYLLHHNAYSFENGFDMSKIKEDIFL